MRSENQARDDDLREFQSEDDPKISSLKVKNVPVKCIVNTAKDETMEYLINEVNHTKEPILIIFIEEKPDLVQVLQHFFGPESSTHNLFKKEVNEFEDHVTFLRFLSTFLQMNPHEALSELDALDLCLYSMNLCCT